MQDIWQTPFETGRKKWSTVPLAHDERIDAHTLSTLPDEELLAIWQAGYDREGELAQRGWYRLLYADFMRGKKILDIGCGLGYDATQFAADGAASVTFADIVEPNLKIVERVAGLKGLSNVEFRYVEDVSSLAEFPVDYDVVMAIGSLHHAPQDAMRAEYAELARRLRPGGRWLQFAYPHVRWEREGCLPFDEWGPGTDGPGTPWTEWYDIPKLLDTLPPSAFAPVFYTEWHDSDFNWFDLVRL